MCIRDRDINDPQKELYGLIYKDYMTVWEESRARLNNARFLSRVQARHYHHREPPVLLVAYAPGLVLCGAACFIICLLYTSRCV